MDFWNLLDTKRLSKDVSVKANNPSGSRLLPVKYQMRTWVSIT